MRMQCGLQRPSCQQCVKSARRCGGYEKTHTFVNTAAHEFGRTNRPNGPVTSKKADDTALMELGASSTFLQKRSLINSQHLVQGPSERTDAELGSLSVIDSLPATNQQALAIFINYSVPELPVSDEVPLSWLHSVASMQKLTDVLPLAAAALSYGWLGRVEHQGSMIDHSYRLYAAAIRALRPRLSQMTADVEAELLAAMQALAIFEVSSQPLLDNLLILNPSSCRCSSTVSKLVMAGQRICRESVACYSYADRNCTLQA